GQCGKLKCCLNYELDSYVDALKDFPDMDGKKLLTKKGDAFLQKVDIFRRMMWFSYRSEPGVFIPMSVDSVRAIVEANSKGETPEELVATTKVVQKITATVELSFDNLVGQDSLTRFDRKKKPKGNVNKGGDRNRSRNNNNQQKPKAQVQQGDKPQEQ